MHGRVCVCVLVCMCVYMCVCVHCCLALTWRCCWWQRDIVCPLPASEEVTAEHSSVTCWSPSAKLPVLLHSSLLSLHLGLLQNHCCLEQNLLTKEATWKAGHPEGSSPTLRSQALTCPLSISPELFLPFSALFPASPSLQQAFLGHCARGQLY